MNTGGFNSQSSESLGNAEWEKNLNDIIAKTSRNLSAVSSSSSSFSSPNHLSRISERSEPIFPLPSGVDVKLLAKEVVHSRRLLSHGRRGYSGFLDSRGGGGGGNHALSTAWMPNGEPPRTSPGATTDDDATSPPGPFTSTLGSENSFTSLLGDRRKTTGRGAPNASPAAQRPHLSLSTLEEMKKIVQRSEEDLQLEIDSRSAAVDQKYSNLRSQIAELSKDYADMFKKVRTTINFQEVLREDVEKLRHGEDGMEQSLRKNVETVADGFRRSQKVVDEIKMQLIVFSDKLSTLEGLNIGSKINDVSRNLSEIRNELQDTTTPLVLRLQRLEKSKTDADQTHENLLDQMEQLKAFALKPVDVSTLVEKALSSSLSGAHNEITDRTSRMMEALERRLVDRIEHIQGLSSRREEQYKMELDQKFAELQRAAAESQKAAFAESRVREQEMERLREVLQGFTQAQVVKVREELLEKANENFLETQERLDRQQEGVDKQMGKMTERLAAVTRELSEHEKSVQSHIQNAMSLANSSLLDRQQSLVVKEISERVRDLSQHLEGNVKSLNATFDAKLQTVSDRLGKDNDSITSRLAELQLEARAKAVQISSLEAHRDREMLVLRQKLTAAVQEWQSTDQSRQQLQQQLDAKQAEHVQATLVWKEKQDRIEQAQREAQRQRQHSLESTTSQISALEAKLQIANEKVCEEEGRCVKLQKKVAVLREELSKLREDSARTAHDHQMRLSKTTEELMSKRAEADHLREIVQRLEKELAKLREQCELIRQKGELIESSKDEDIAALEQELSSITAEFHEYQRSQSAAMRRMDLMVREKQQSARELEARLVDLQAQLRSSRSFDADAGEPEHRSGEKEAISTTLGPVAKIAELESALERTSVETLTAAESAFTSEYEAKTRRVKELEEEVLYSREEIQTLQSRVSQIQKLCKEKELELENQIAKANLDSTNLLKTSLDVSNKMSSLEDVQEATKVGPGVVPPHAKVNAQLQARMQALEAEREANLVAIDNLKVERTVLEVKCSNEISSLYKEAEALQERVDLLQKEKEDVLAQTLDLTMEYERKRENLLGAVDHVTEEIAQLEKDLLQAASTAEESSDAKILRTNGENMPSKAEPTQKLQTLRSSIQEEFPAIWRIFDQLSSLRAVAMDSIRDIHLFKEVAVEMLMDLPSPQAETAAPSPETAQHVHTREPLPKVKLIKAICQLSAARDRTALEVREIERRLRDLRSSSGPRGNFGENQLLQEGERSEYGYMSSSLKRRERVRNVLGQLKRMYRVCIVIGTSESPGAEANGGLAVNGTHKGNVALANDSIESSLIQADVEWSGKVDGYDVKKPLVGTANRLIELMVFAQRLQDQLVMTQSKTTEYWKETHNLKTTVQLSLSQSGGSMAAKDAVVRSVIQERESLDKAYVDACCALDRHCSEIQSTLEDVEEELKRTQEKSAGWRHRADAMKEEVQLLGSTLRSVDATSFNSALTLNETISEDSAWAVSTVRESLLLVETEKARALASAVSALEVSQAHSKEESHLSETRPASHLIESGILISSPGLATAVAQTRAKLSTPATPAAPAEFAYNRHVHQGYDTAHTLPTQPKDVIKESQVGEAHTDLNPQISSHSRLASSSSPSSASSTKEYSSSETAAVIKIQSFVRQKSRQTLARQKRGHNRKGVQSRAASRIQRIYRQHSSIKSSLKDEAEEVAERSVKQAAAIKIQSLARRSSAKRALVLLKRKKVQTQAARMQAATTLQSLARRNSAMKLSLQLRSAKEVEYSEEMKRETGHKERAAKKLQKFARRLSAQSRVISSTSERGNPTDNNHDDDELDEEEAALRLQSFARRLLAQKVTKQMRASSEQKRQEQAAVKIQSFQRRAFAKITTMKTHPTLHEETSHLAEVKPTREEIAALTIQASFKRLHTKRKSKRMREADAAKCVKATIMQYHRKRERRKQHEKGAALTIQSSLKRYHGQRMRTREREAIAAKTIKARTIQYHEKLKRKKHREEGAAQMIQSTLRRHHRQLKSEREQRTAASTLIGETVRQHYRRRQRVRERELKAARVIQASFRQHYDKRKGLKERLEKIQHNAAGGKQTGTRSQFDADSKRRKEPDRNEAATLIQRFLKNRQVKVAAGKELLPIEVGLEISAQGRENIVETPATSLADLDPEFAKGIVKSIPHHDQDEGYTHELHSISRKWSDVDDGVEGWEYDSDHDLTNPSYGKAIPANASKHSVATHVEQSIQGSFSEEMTGEGEVNGTSRHYNGDLDEEKVRSSTVSTFHLLDDFDQESPTNREAISQSTLPSPGLTTTLSATELSPGRPRSPPQIVDAPASTTALSLMERLKAARAAKAVSDEAGLINLPDATSEIQGQAVVTATEVSDQDEEELNGDIEVEELNESVASEPDFDNDFDEQRQSTNSFDDENAVMLKDTAQVSRQDLMQPTATDAVEYSGDFEEEFDLQS